VSDTLQIISINTQESILLDEYNMDYVTAESLVPGPSHLEVELLLQTWKSDQIPAELIQAGGETLLTTIHKLIIFIFEVRKIAWTV
jgi:hypothetical protein